jgi:hypothetical protein
MVLYGSSLSTCSLLMSINLISCLSILSLGYRSSLLSINLASCLSISSLVYKSRLLYINLVFCLSISSLVYQSRLLSINLVSCLSISSLVYKFRLLSINLGSCLSISSLVYHSRRPLSLLKLSCPSHLWPHLSSLALYLYLASPINMLTSKGIWILHVLYICTAHLIHIFLYVSILQLAEGCESILTISKSVVFFFPSCSGK